MSAATASEKGAKIKAAIWLSVAVCVIVFLAANTHLVYVAISSEPDCVAHIRRGESSGENSFSAATSSCSSEPAMTSNTQVK